MCFTQVSNTKEAFFSFKGVKLKGRNERAELFNQQTVLKSNSNTSLKCVLDYSLYEKYYCYPKKYKAFLLFRNSRGINVCRLDKM